MVQLMKKSDRNVLKVLLITLFLNLSVAILKLIYSQITQSLSLEADGFHSLFDSSSNVIGLVALLFAFRPANEKHPYGHRKIEALASMGISFLLFFTCYELIGGIVDRLENPADVKINLASFLVMFLSMTTNFFVARYEDKKGHELKSEFLHADAKHTKSDIYVSLSVIGSFVASKIGYPIFDIIIAAIITIFIIITAFIILFDSFKILTDAQILNTDEVKNVVESVPGIYHSHKIRSHGTKGGVYLDLHIHVNPTLSTSASHRLTHKVIDTLKEQYPEIIDVMIHTEPAKEA